MACGEPAGPADGVHDIRQLTAPARPQAAAEFGAIRHVRLSFCAYTVTLCLLPGEDAGELAESGVVRARARAGARVQGLACCATMAIFIGCLLAGRIFVTVSCQGDGK
jgi:hypothetical protein